MSFLSSSSTSSHGYRASFKNGLPEAYPPIVTNTTTSTLRFAKNEQIRKSKKPKPRIRKEIERSTEADGSSRTCYTFTFPIVCYKTNGPFFAQCSTTKQGLCPRCNTVKIPGKVLDGGFCGDCNARLLPSYKRWYPGLIKIDHVDETRKRRTYEKNRKLFANFGIHWQDDDQLDFVREHYTLLKVYATISEFPIEPLQAERTYMVGVFAGRQYRTAALARNFLRDNLGLTPFRMDYTHQFRPNDRADIAECMNRKFFKGDVRCYFHAHRGNIEGWYDSDVVDISQVSNYFKHLCTYSNKHGSLHSIAEPIPDHYKPIKPKSKSMSKYHHPHGRHGRHRHHAKHTTTTTTKLVDEDTDEVHSEDWDSTSNDTDSVASSPHSHCSASAASTSGTSVTDGNSVVYQPIYIQAGTNYNTTPRSAVSETATTPSQQSQMQPILMAPPGQGPQGQPIRIMYPQGGQGQGQCMMMPMNMIQPMNCFYPDPQKGSHFNQQQQPFQPIIVAPPNGNGPCFFPPQQPGGQQQPYFMINPQQQQMFPQQQQQQQQSFQAQAQVPQQVQAQSYTDVQRQPLTQPQTQPQQFVESRESSSTPESSCYDSSVSADMYSDNETEYFSSHGHVRVNQNAPPPPPPQNQNSHNYHGYPPSSAGHNTTVTPTGYKVDSLAVNECIQSFNNDTSNVTTSRAMPKRLKGLKPSRMPLPPPLFTNGKPPTHLPSPHKVKNPYNSQAVFSEKSMNVGLRPSGCVV